MKFCDTTYTVAYQRNEDGDLIQEKVFTDREEALHEMKQRKEQLASNVSPKKFANYSFFIVRSDLTVTVEDFDE